MLSELIKRACHSKTEILKYKYITFSYKMGENVWVTPNDDDENIFKNYHWKPEKKLKVKRYFKRYDIKDRMLTTYHMSETLKKLNIYIGTSN